MRFVPHPFGRQWLIYRANPPALSNLPLTVQSVGCYEMTAGWREGPIRKWFLEIFWTIKGRGSIKAEDQWIRVKTGDVFIYQSGEIHELKAEEGGWHYCWITFDHPDATLWLRGFGLNGRTLKGGQCPVRIFEEVAAQLGRCIPDGERQGSHLAHSLLLNLSSGSVEPRVSSPAIHAKQIIDKSCHDPLVGVSEIADRIGIHRTTLFRLFQQQFGLTPSRYLQNLRMQKALSMLRGTVLPIQEVGRLCGFADPNYFSRSVRRATGMNPREFRRGQKLVAQPGNRAKRQKKKARRRAP